MAGAYLRPGMQAWPDFWRKILFQQASSRQAAYALSPERYVAFLLFPGYAIDPTYGKREIVGHWDVGGPWRGRHVCKRE